MKKNLVVLFVLAALGNLSGSANAQAKGEIVPGADCLPFWGSAEVYSNLNDLRPCSATVPVVVYLTKESPHRLAIFATVPGGVNGRGNCLAPEKALGDVTLVRHAQGAVGSLAMWGDKFSLDATPADMATQDCLAHRTGPDTAVTSAQVSGWDGQHVVLSTP